MNCTAEYDYEDDDADEQSGSWRAAHRVGGRRMRPVLNPQAGKLTDRSKGSETRTTPGSPGFGETISSFP